MSDTASAAEAASPVPPRVVSPCTVSPADTATYREIRQQPAVWRETARILRARRGELDAFLAPLLARPGLRIVLTGAGSSAFIGQIAAPSLAARLGRRVEAVATTDLVSHPAAFLAEDVPTLLVSFARSGDSPESAAATELAGRLLHDVSHLIVTCNPAGALRRAHEGRADSFVLLTPERSHDEGFAMTSSFTAMLLSVLLALRGEDDDAAGAAIDALATAAEAVLEQEPRVAAIAGLAPRRAVYLGGGPLAGLARECALKVLELTAGRVAAFHDSSLGFRHGPKAVLDDDSIAVVFRSADPYSRAYDEDIISELRGRLGDERVFALSAGPVPDALATDWVLGDGQPAADADPDRPRFPGLAELDDAWLAAVHLVFGQLLALHCSIALGLPPDNPFPAGDVNRVVRGVTIHPLPAGALASTAGR
jgi:tagatose-6-phosphate ketose/aldose isomerase